MIREPFVAGQFYAGSGPALKEQIKSFVDRQAVLTDAIGAVSPHAGYVYSGSVAGKVFSSIRAKATYIILGPNHTGSGAMIGIDRCDAWATPIGEVKVDRRLAGEIIGSSSKISRDNICHEQEHSIEVQIPFLQYLFKDFSIVPIAVSGADIETYREIGSAIAGSVKALKMERDVTIIASSDMTHYESSDDAKRKDSVAIEAVLKLDEALLVERVQSMDITMCGSAPTAIMITAAKELGARTARLIKYCNSGDVSGDYDSVVGYAGIIIS